MIPVLDLFSGIGGFSLGLERTGGFKTVAFCEIDNYCQRVLHKHWPDVYIHSDIRTLGAKHFEQYRKPDLICGGFPCQDISTAGKQAGIHAERSGLWFEMLRVIAELHPRWVLVENVAALKTKGADEVLSGLEAEGYTCWPTVVGAWAVGARHNRDRAWILAYSKYNGSHEAQDGRSDAETLQWASEGQECPEQFAGVRVSRMLASDVCDSTSAGLPNWAGGEVGQPSPLTEFERPDGREVELSFCGVAHGVSNRVQRLKCLGNSVVPQIPELFGHAILQLDKQFKEAK